MTNPLLAPWDTPFGLPPFDRIEDDHWMPAAEAAIAEARAAVEAIAANPEPPTFDNTIAALEMSDEAMGRVLGAFYAVASADSSPARQVAVRTTTRTKIPITKQCRR